MLLVYLVVLLEFARIRSQISVRGGHTFKVSTLLFYNINYRRRNLDWEWECETKSEREREFWTGSNRKRRRILDKKIARN